MYLGKIAVWVRFVATLSVCLVAFPRGPGVDDLTRTGDTSGRDLLAQALAKTNSVRSLRISRTEMSDLGQVAERTNLDIIQVEDDLYARRTDELRIGANWRSRSARNFEELIFGGRQFKRDLTTGRWELDAPTEADLVVNVVRSNSAARPHARRIQHGFDLPSVSNITEVKHEQLGGEAVIHLVGAIERVPFGERAEELKDKFKSDISRFSAQPTGAAERILGETHISGSVDVWIGVEDMFLRQFVWIERYVRGGVVVKSKETTVRLSGFNESLKLPPPLPGE